MKKHARPRKISAVAGAIADFLSRQELSRQDPPAAFIRFALEAAAEGELAEFADELAVARDFFRRYPDLVLAEKFPEHLIEPLKNNRAIAPEDCVATGEPFLTDAVLAELLPFAKECASSMTPKKGVRTIHLVTAPT